MKKGLFAILALVVVLGITTGALAGARASAKQTSRFCVYIDKTGRGNSHLDISADPKYGHKTSSSASRVRRAHQVRKALPVRRVQPGATGATGATGSQGPKVVPALPVRLL